MNKEETEENTVAAMHTLDGLKSAYSNMTYSMFLEVLGGRDDSYWQEHWQLFKEVSQKIGKLGSFFPILVNYGHEMRASKGLEKIKK